MPTNNDFAKIENQNYFYKGITPQADTVELAENGDRIMLKHDWHGMKIFVAPKDVLHAGWVIGVDLEKTTLSPK